MVHKENIVHINTFDWGGGAAMVAHRLVAGLRTKGVNASLLVGMKTRSGELSQGFDIGVDPVIEEQCRRQGFLYYQYRGSLKLTQNPLVISADILHLHNLHGDYFNPFSLPALTCFRPTLWTLHDMQSITGHCAHSFECRRWITGCNTCPALSTYPEVSIDRCNLLWQHKKTIYRDSILDLVVPSEWLRRKVAASILSNHPIHLIYNGVDTKVFKPVPRDDARAALGLPINDILIGAVADTGPTENPWKGGAYVKTAMEAVLSRWPNSWYVAVGGAQRGVSGRLISLGRIDDPAVLALVLSALDVFFYPSLADNCPLVILEALACGVPIAAFATGGIPELVTDGISGRVAPYRDATALIVALNDLIADAGSRERFRMEARDAAVNRFDHEHILDQYQKLYANCADDFARRKAELGDRNEAAAIWRQYENM